MRSQVWPTDFAFRPEEFEQLIVVVAGSILLIQGEESLVSCHFWPLAVARLADGKEARKNKESFLVAC